MAMASTVSLKCAGCKRQNHSIWSALSRSELAFFEKACRLRIYQRGDTIFNQDDDPQGLYCVAQGQVLLRQYDAFGNETVFLLTMPGDVIGYRSFFAQEPHAASARALTVCHVCFIPRHVVDQLVAKNAKLARLFLRTLARDAGPQHAALLRNPHLPVRVRLARLILLLKERCATSSHGGDFVFELPLSRGEIAAMVGVRPETVTRTIHDFEEDQVCAFRGRQVIITDIDRLCEIVGVPASSAARLLHPALHS